MLNAAPTAGTEKLTRIERLAVVIDSRHIHDDWTEALALAVDAFDAGARPFGPGSLTDREKTVLALRKHAPALWAHLDNREAACLAFEHLLASA